ncbi:MAG TPA: hypothetical protein VFV95_15375 [Vicinamibacterales bacterium]|nr:hypothetical protein [Vicinamibacterales bacterium]
MRYLIGIDDTDNLESRGTGHRARQLGELLGRSGTELLGITRHQLLVDPAIPYTSHNSSACIEVRTAQDGCERLIDVCRGFLREESAPGSDAGLCVANADAVRAEVVEFGARAKLAIVERAHAEQIADRNGMHLEPLTGTGLGVIGALAAVGLRTGGNDGRFLWLPALRETAGVHRASELIQRLHLDAIETETGTPVDGHERVCVGEWLRPLMRRGRKTMLVQETDHEDYRWSGLGKERLKQLSD